MPRVLRTVLPRIRASIARRGVMMSLCRSVLLPVHLVREYRAAKNLRKNGPRSEFDAAHGVDTDGDFGGWTYLSDLNIASPNWIHGVNYTGIEPARFWMALLSVALKHEDFTFIDFGSGKGRALLIGAGGGVGIIVGNVFEDVLEPALSFFGPRYRCHERMRCAICSFEMMRLASESASPRAIMT
jgi:hypothetical protein